MNAAIKTNIEANDQPAMRSLPFRAVSPSRSRGQTSSSSIHGLVDIGVSFTASLVKNNRNRSFRATAIINVADASQSGYIKGQSVRRGAF